jgi:hypothetical protein
VKTPRLLKFRRVMIGYRRFPFLNALFSFFQRKSHAMDKEEVKIIFYVEASVGLAKSSVFLSTAEEDLIRGDLVSAAISGYYSIFHLTLALMWLFADELPKTVLDRLMEIRKKGNELPSSEVTHTNAQRFLCDGQLKLSNKKELCFLFRKTQDLREFANYGPRVTWKDGHPFIGPCHFSIDQVKELVPKLRPAFISTVKLATPATAIDGDLGKIVLRQATALLTHKQFPFSTWSSEKIQKEALTLLSTLYDESLTD